MANQDDSDPQPLVVLGDDEPTLPEPARAVRAPAMDEDDDVAAVARAMREMVPRPPPVPRDGSRSGEDPDDRPTVPMGEPQTDANERASLPAIRPPPPSLLEPSASSLAPITRSAGPSRAPRRRALLPLAALALLLVAAGIWIARGAHPSADGASAAVVSAAAASAPAEAEPAAEPPEATGRLIVEPGTLQWVDGAHGDAAELAGAAPAPVSGSGPGTPAAAPARPARVPVRAQDRGENPASSAHPPRRAVRASRARSPGRRESARQSEAAGEKPAAPARPQVLSRADIVAGLKPLAAEVAACSPDRSGVAQVDLRIDSSGRVAHAVVVGDFAGTPQGSCIARAVRRARFKPFQQPQLRVLYPFAL